MKWSSLSLLIFFWLNLYSQYIAAIEPDPSIQSQFRKYKKCLEAYLVPTWKLLGTHYNGSYYEILNFQFNKIYEKAYPVAIFTPLNSIDVQRAVQCGIKTDIQLVPIAGGHSYAGLSIGNNRSILLDFRYMNAISINRKDKVATVEAGTFLGHLYGVLWKNGRFGAPLGVCSTVAMGGLAIGGGVGYFSTLYGLVIDNLEEINMVDARGNEVRVNKTHNDDLWWAMRGVGPGYIGLVTSVKLKLFKAGDLTLTTVQIRFRNDSFKRVMASYLKWLDWVKENDPSINSVILIMSDKYKNPKPLWPGIEIQILQVKDPRYRNTGKSSFMKILQSIFPNPVDFIVNYPTYIEFILQNGYTPVVHTKHIPEDIESRLDFLSSLSRDQAIPRYYFAKTFFVKKRYDAANLREAEKILLEMPNTGLGIQINTEQGAIGQRRSNDSAYVHRNSLYNFRIFFDSLDAENVKPSKAWSKKFLKSVQFLDSGETYQNYPDRELPDYLDRYYGSNLERLINIKRKWDPNGYFRSRMSIPIN